MDTQVETLSLEGARLVATPFTRGTGKGQAIHLRELSLTEEAIYMSGSGLLQYIALDRLDVVFATKEVRSRTAKSRCAGTVVLAQSGKVFGWSSRGRDELSVPRKPITDRLPHGYGLGWRRGNTMVNDSWNVDAWGSLA